MDEILKCNVKSRGEVTHGKVSYSGVFIKYLILCEVTT
jgi:hypothetical protein